MRTFCILSFILLLLTGCNISIATPTQAPLLPTQTSVIPTETQSTVEPGGVISLTACVEKYSLRVRSGPGTQYEALGGVPAGTCVAAGGRNQDASWIWVTFDDLSGWVTSEYLVINGDISSLPTEFERVNLKNTPIPLDTETPSQPTPTVGKTNTPRVEYILCTNTWTRIGEEVTCKLPKASCTYMTSVNGKPTYCNDIPYPDHNFTLLVWGSDWSHFDGKCLLISGQVTQVDGKPQIEANGTVEVSICQ